MNKRRFSALCVCVALIASVLARAEAEFAYDKNTFIKDKDCLGVYPGTSLALDEKVWIFSDGLSPMIGKVVHVIPAAKAKKAVHDLLVFGGWPDNPLWTDPEIRCANPFRGDLPESLARITPVNEKLGFAIRGLPAGALVAQGQGESVPMAAKDNPYLNLVWHLITDHACHAPDSLIRVRQFPVRKGRTIVQLDIGKVTKVSPEKRRQNIEKEMRRLEQSNPSPGYKKMVREDMEKTGHVESVEICRFFLDEKRVVKEEMISRRTGVDERVDTAPDLNTDNWADTTKSTIGFISLNEGKDWDVLQIDVGWEGINYSIQRLDGSGVHYHRYLYTHH